MPTAMYTDSQTNEMQEKNVEHFIYNWLFFWRVPIRRIKERSKKNRTTTLLSTIYFMMPCYSDWFFYIFWYFILLFVCSSVSIRGGSFWEASNQQKQLLHIPEQNRFIFEAIHFGIILKFEL